MSLVYFKNRKLCLVCSFKDSYPICKECLKDSLKIEHCRQILASENLIGELKMLYSSSLPSVNNKNTSFFWDKAMVSKHYLKDQDEMTKERINTAASFLPKGTRKILDLGAGYGYLEEILSKAEHDYELFGCDISAKAIEGLSNRFKGKFKRGQVLRMKYPKKNFDAVFALEIIEHISPKEITNFYSYAKNLLSPLGVFIVSVPLNETVEKFDDNPSRHVRQYTKDLIIAELSFSGFKVIDFRELFSFKHLYFLKKFLAEYIFKKRWKPNNIVLFARIV